MPCDVERDLLYAWVDGEAGTRTESITVHQARCQTCRSRLAALHLLQHELEQQATTLFDDAEPLLALQRIRQDPAACRHRLGGPTRDAWAFAWQMHRRRTLVGLCTGGAVAATLAYAVMTVL